MLTVSWCFPLYRILYFVYMTAHGYFFYQLLQEVINLNFAFYFERVLKNLILIKKKTHLQTPVSVWTTRVHNPYKNTKILYLENLFLTKGPVPFVSRAHKRDTMWARRYTVLKVSFYSTAQQFLAKKTASKELKYIYIYKTLVSNVLQCCFLQRILEAGTVWASWHSVNTERSILVSSANQDTVIEWM